MNINKNMLFLLLLPFYTVGRDDLGDRMKLINCVMHHESRIQTIMEDLGCLWHKCYEYKLNSDQAKRYVDVIEYYGDENVIDHLDKHEVNNICVSQAIYKQEGFRRNSCLDSDIIAYQNCLKDLQKAIENAVYDIGQIVANDVTIVRNDYYGKTALNYCYTREIYDELIRQGVPFQWTVWVSFNAERIFLLGCGITVATALGYNCFADNTAVE